MPQFEIKYTERRVVTVRAEDEEHANRIFANSEYDYDRSTYDEDSTVLVSINQTSDRDQVLGEGIVRQAFGTGEARLDLGHATTQAPFADVSADSTLYERVLDVLSIREHGSTRTCEGDDRGRLRIVGRIVVALRNTDAVLVAFETRGMLPGDGEDRVRAYAGLCDEQRWLRTEDLSKPWEWDTVDDYDTRCHLDTIWDHIDCLSARETAGMLV